MKKYQLVLILLLNLSSTAFAQNFSKEYGKIAKEEIELTVYEKDPIAEAVVLFDIGKSYFVDREGVYDVVFERTKRIKILSEAGIKWAKVEIPFYREGDIYEKVYDIEAYTYNYENGLVNKTKFDVSQCYDEKLNERWTLKKFAIPNVREGSIIEFKYKVRSQHVFNLQDWEFQSKIPTVYSKYEVSMIPYYEYTYLLQGRSKFDEHKSHTKPRETIQYDDFKSIKIEDMVHEYTMKNIPAFRDEGFITSINDYIIKLDFQLAKVNFKTRGSQEIITTWAKLIQELNKHEDFGKYIKKSKKSAPKLLNIDEILTKAPKERFNTVLDYVKNNYKWNNFQGKYTTKSSGKFLKEKHGSCADINLFTIGLLNAVGIEAYPVLSSTRSHGKIKYDYPYSHFFNYVLIYANVDGKVILSDATDPLNANERIPVRCVNDKGLIVEKDKQNWVKLSATRLSEVQYFFTNTPSGEEIKTDIMTYATQYKGLYNRKVYGKNKQKIKEELNKKSYNVSEESIGIKNYLKKNKPYYLSYKASTKSENINGKLYISPFLSEVLTENPFKQKTRKHSIDMVYPEKKTYNSTIVIPQGYEVDYVPPSDAIKNELFELNYTVIKDDKNVKITFMYSFKKSIYSATDYSKLKFYYNKIIKLGNEKVALKKTN